MKCALLPCLGGLEIVYDCIRDLYAQCVNGRYVCCTAPPLPWWAWDCIRRGVDPSRASGRCSGSSNSWLRPGRYWCWRIPSSSEPFIPLLTPILMLIMTLKLIIQQKLIKTFNLRWTSTFPAIDADTFYAIAPFNSVTTSFLLLDVTFMNLPYFSDSENTKQKWNRQEEYIFIVKPF